MASLTGVCLCYRLNNQYPAIAVLWRSQSCLPDTKYLMHIQVGHSNTIDLDRLIVLGVDIAGIMASNQFSLNFNFHDQRKHAVVIM